MPLGSSATPRIVAFDPDAERTSRQRVLPGFGIEAQQRLRDARVLVVGAGGTGTPVILYLAGAGVGRLDIVDDDVVAVSNLPRQVAYGMSVVGASKAATAAERARDLSPHSDIRGHDLRLSRDTVERIVSAADVVVDCTDGLTVRFLLDDACAARNVPLVWGCALGYDGYASVFWADPPGGGGVRLRDVFDESVNADADEAEGGCAVSGVFGPLCGQVGAVLVGEVLKLIVGVGDPLLGRVLVFDARTGRQREVQVRSLGAPATPDGAGARPYAGHPAGQGHVHRPAADHVPIRLVTVDQLRERLAGADPPQLLDVRDAWEHADAAIPTSLNLAYSEIAAGVRDGLDPDRPVVLYCAVHTRSVAAARLLDREGYRTEVLIGGMQAWQQLT